MARRRLMFTVRLSMVLASVLCAVASVEMVWRIHGLGLVIAVERRFPPLSAEAMSTKAAPLLRDAVNADPIYRIVQSQHVDLQQKHDFVIEVAQSARKSAWISLACTAVALVLLLVACGRLRSEREIDGGGDDE